MTSIHWAALGDTPAHDAASAITSARAGTAPIQDATYRTLLGKAVIQRCRLGRVVSQDGRAQVVVLHARDVNLAKDWQEALVLDGVVEDNFHRGSSRSFVVRVEGRCLEASGKLSADGE